MLTTKNAASVNAPQPIDQPTDTETYSKGILGPVSFKLSKLTIAGSNADPADPVQSGYIVASNEKFTVSVDIEFNSSPLSKLLMCLGTKLSVDFGFEGYGKGADEVDINASIVTKKDDFTYTISTTMTPDEAKLTAGLYQIGATITVGPGSNECAQYVFGYGYIDGLRFQVYPAM